MTELTVRRSFIALHLTLGVVVLFESVRTLVHALGAPASHLHLGVLATVETIAALLFLWPRTLRIGGGALVVIFLIAVVTHALRGEFSAPLLVYAAAALFVTVHGSAWSAAQRAVAA
jgi:hypothetical protein